MLFSPALMNGSRRSCVSTVSFASTFAVRQLYTNDDEVLFQASRPILLNGIEDVIRRPDLADRTIFLTLAAITEAQRRPEQDLWREFEIARPRLLGALLDAAVHGLRKLPRVRLERLPRMADFALWAMACETAFWPAGTFLRAYAANRRAAVESVIDSDPVAACVWGIMANRRTWTGSASDLLRAGANLAGDDVSRRSAGWPRNPRALASRLRRVQTFLRTFGIEIAFSREGRAGTRTIHMTAAPDNPLRNIVSTVSSACNEDLQLGPETLIRDEGLFVERANDADASVTKVGAVSVDGRDKVV
jgi:hypothetical protein